MKNDVKNIKKIVALFIICISLMQACLAWGPPQTYSHNDVELYSVAIHSIIGVCNFGLDEIIVLEEDPYGRKLFFANLTKSSYVGDGISGVFISQKKDNQYIYYYEGINYIIKAGYISALSQEKALNCFSQEEIEVLKKQNDWGYGQNTKPLFKVPITGNKDYLFEKITDESLNSTGELVFYKTLNTIPMSEDAFGNSIWFMKGKTSEADLQEKCYVFLFNADGEIKSDNAFMEINDIWNYRDQMIAFKEANGWNQP